MTDTTGIEDIETRILTGDLDDTLADVARAVETRRRMIAARTVGQLRVGDRIRFNDTTSPKYLIGVEAVVTKKLQKNVTVELDEGVGRFPAGAEIRVPASLVETIEEG